MKAEHYSNRNIMSYDRNLFPWRGIIGARGIGKSFSAGNLLANQYKEYRHIPEDTFNVDDMFLWLRLTPRALDKMKGRFLDPKIERKTGIRVEEVDNRVYFNDRLVGYKLALSDGPTIKGGVWPWTRFKYVILDEFQRERSERKTFDVVYNLRSVLESTCRFTTRLNEGYDLPYVIFMGNTVDEATDLLYAFDFLPMKHGIYKLRNKSAIIQFAPNSKRYDELQRRNPLRVLETENDYTFGVRSFSNKYNLLNPRYAGHITYVGHLDLTEYLTVQVWQAQNGRWLIAKDLQTKKFENKHYVLSKLAANKSNFYSVAFHKQLREQMNNNMISFDTRLTALVFHQNVR